MSRLRAEAARAATAALGRTTDSGYAFNEARREVAWWVNARLAGIQAHSLRMLRGSGLCVSYGGYVELVPVDVPAPGAGQVTVRSEISAINVGTERAQYLKLPNAARIEGRQPAGSMAGVVVAVGRGVRDLQVGRRVAVGGAPHASVVTVPEASAVPLPDGVSFADAALVTHGIIAGQGLRLAQLERGTRFGIVGLGIIGAMTLRLATAAGATAEAAVATSTAKADLARRSGAETFLTTRDDGDAIDALALPVVFEVTGDPQALATAVRMTAPGGRVILLGSSRGTTDAMPIDVIRDRGLTLVGAHVDTLRREAESQPRSGGTAGEAERRAANDFLDAARGRRGTLRRSPHPRRRSARGSDPVSRDRGGSRHRRGRPGLVAPARRAAAGPLELPAPARRDRSWRGLRRAARAPGAPRLRGRAASVPGSAGRGQRPSALRDAGLRRHLHAQCRRDRRRPQRRAGRLL